MSGGNPLEWYKIKKFVRFEEGAYPRNMYFTVYRSTGKEGQGVHQSVTSEKSRVKLVVKETLGKRVKVLIQGILIQCSRGRDTCQQGAIGISWPRSWRVPMVLGSYEFREYTLPCHKRILHVLGRHMKFSGHLMDIMKYTTVTVYLSTI